MKITDMVTIKSKYNNDVYLIIEEGNIRYLYNLQYGVVIHKLTPRVVVLNSNIMDVNIMTYTLEEHGKIAFTKYYKLTENEVGLINCDKEIMKNMKSDNSDRYLINMEGESYIFENYNDPCGSRVVVVSLLDYDKVYTLEKDMFINMDVYFRNALVRLVHSGAFRDKL